MYITKDILVSILAEYEGSRYLFGLILKLKEEQPNIVQFKTWFKNVFHAYRGSDTLRSDVTNDAQDLLKLIEIIVIERTIDNTVEKTIFNKLRNQFRLEWNYLGKMYANGILTLQTLLLGENFTLTLYQQLEQAHLLTKENLSPLNSPQGELYLNMLLALKTDQFTSENLRLIRLLHANQIYWAPEYIQKALSVMHKFCCDAETTEKFFQTKNIAMLIQALDKFYDVKAVPPQRFTALCASIMPYNLAHAYDTLDQSLPVVTPAAEQIINQAPDCEDAALALVFLVNNNLFEHYAELLNTKHPLLNCKLTKWLLDHKLNPITNKPLFNIQHTTLLTLLFELEETITTFRQDHINFILCVNDNILKTFELLKVLSANKLDTPQNLTAISQHKYKTHLIPALANLGDITPASLELMLTTPHVEEMPKLLQVLETNQVCWEETIKLLKSAGHGAIGMTDVIVRLKYLGLATEEIIQALQKGLEDIAKNPKNESHHKFFSKKEGVLSPSLLIPPPLPSSIPQGH